MNIMCNQLISDANFDEIWTKMMAKYSNEVIANTTLLNNHNDNYNYDNDNIVDHAVLLLDGPSLSLEAMLLTLCLYFLFVALLCLDFENSFSTYIFNDQLNTYLSFCYTYVWYRILLHVWLFSLSAYDLFKHLNSQDLDGRFIGFLHYSPN